MFTQHDVGGKVFRSPAVEQRGCLGSELFENIAHRTSLLRVKRQIRHNLNYPIR
jgi:hypothetical protein